MCVCVVRNIMFSLPIKSVPPVNNNYFLVKRQVCFIIIKFSRHKLLFYFTFDIITYNQCVNS